VATGAKDSQEAPRAAKQSREFKRQIDDLSGTVAELNETLRALRTTTGEETLDIRSRIHEFDRRLTLLERAVAQQPKPEPKTNSK
jgi:hypothetical protein